MVWQTLQHYFKMFDLDFFFFLSKFDVYKIKVIEQFCMRLCWRYETIYRKLHGELPVGKQSVFLALPLRQDKLWLVRKLSISHYLTYLTTKTKLLIIKITDQKKKKSAGQSASVEKETELTFQAGKHQLHRCCLTHIFAFCDISDFHHLQPLNHAFNLLSKLFPQ